MDRFVIRKTKNISGTSENDVRSENNNENHSLNSEISDSTHNNTHNILTSVQLSLTYLFLHRYNIDVYLGKIYLYVNRHTSCILVDSYDENDFYKRTVFSAIAKALDPTGLVGPVTPN
jgi:hypothetical protein